jgi:uncharacterized protein (TIGR00288 family)
LNGDRLKIAVFIDFDNIEIGVKSTLNRHFDVGTVLEAIKERGEVVTKIAYGDWKRAGEHSRSMAQHAIQMVQRNLTPGGDKNGADINLALDALEMAFTRNHINAFVIVGGDSDFLALVEKLKQYDKKVMVVGGRSFTSVILQKNCHEFIAYENLIAAPQTHSSARRPAADRARVAAAGDASLAKALPLVRRALKVLTDREVSPQLGLLKSTLLQLDSTFSERDYGAGTFRDFIEKMASAGYVTLKQVDRSLLVESTDVELPAAPAGQPGATLGGSDEAVEREAVPRTTHAPAREPREGAPAASAEVASGASNGQQTTPTAEQIEDAIRNLTEVFQSATVAPHWPMYLRNVKQYIKNAAPAFDERKYGFTNFLETVRACQRAGLFRLERNRQGILRVFPGPQFPHQTVVAPMSAAEQEKATEAAFIAAAEAAILAAEPLIESSSSLVTSSEAPSDPTLFPDAEDKPARKRTPRAASDASKRRPSAGRARTAAPRRTARKKPADVEGND